MTPAEYEERFNALMDGANECFVVTFYHGSDGEGVVGVFSDPERAQQAAILWCEGCLNNENERVEWSQEDAMAFIVGDDVDSFTGAEAHVETSRFQAS